MEGVCGGVCVEGCVWRGVCGGCVWRGVCGGVCMEGGCMEGCVCGGVYVCMERCVSVCVVCVLEGCVSEKVLRACCVIDVGKKEIILFYLKVTFSLEVLRAPLSLARTRLRWSNSMMKMVSDSAKSKLNTGISTPQRITLKLTAKK